MLINQREAAILFAHVFNEATEESTGIAGLIPRGAEVIRNDDGSTYVYFDVMVAESGEGVHFKAKIEFQFE